jgi:hypothetical protein
MDNGKKQKWRKTGTPKMKFLRKVAGYALEGQIRNTVIRDKLNIFNINNIIQNDRLHLIYHVERTKPERI